MPTWGFVHPENTMRAFRQALAIGVDGIELDVHATADGIPVVIHDRDIGRTTNGDGYVDQVPLVRLETFDAGQGERVPTLAEVLWVGDAAHLDIEYKGEPRRASRVGRARSTPLSSVGHLLVRLGHARTTPARPGRDFAARRVRRRRTLIAVATELASPAVSLYTDAYTAENAARLRDAGLASWSGK